MFKRVVLPLLLIVVLAAVYFWAAVNWSYSSGERAGWVQKLSKKGWLCKTWEGELALVSLPGTTPEKFMFTIWDDAVAARVTQAMGKRVNLHYEEKVGLPGSCFGETRHYVTGVTASEEIPLAAGVVVQTPAGAAAASAAAAAATAAAAVTPPASAAIAKP
jgi:hypothetical protein